MSKPLVTLGLTAFNAEDTVARALGSALAQTWRPLEIIVVDDASTDNTRSVIDAIAVRHHNIRVVVNARNSGAAVARNEIVDRIKRQVMKQRGRDRVAGRILQDRVAVR